MNLGKGCIKIQRSYICIAKLPEKINCYEYVNKNNNNKKDCLCHPRPLLLVKERSHRKFPFKIHLIFSLGDTIFTSWQSIWIHLESLKKMLIRKDKRRIWKDTQFFKDCENLASDWIPHDVKRLQTFLKGLFRY